MSSGWASRQPRFSVHRAASKAQPAIEDLKGATEKQLNAFRAGEFWLKRQKIHVIGELWVVGGIKELAMIKACPLRYRRRSIDRFCVLAAHGIMKRQQGALVAAYAAIDATPRTYRERVREDHGGDGPSWSSTAPGSERRREGVDDYGEACVINENDPRIASQYGQFFDPTSSANWLKTVEPTGRSCSRSRCTPTTGWRSRISVPERRLPGARSLRESQTGQVVGWRLGGIYGGNDGYVDFGPDDIGDENSRAFRNLLDESVSSSTSMSTARSP